MNIKYASNMFKSSGRAIRLFLGMLFCLGLQASAESDIEWSGFVQWDSHYVAEGEKVVPGLTVISGAEAEWKGVALSVEWVRALGRTYNELHVMLGYGFEAGPFELFAGINRVMYPAVQDESSSWEIHAGVELPLEWFTLYAEGFYDIDEVSGGFAEIGITTEWVVPGTGDRASIEPYIQWGIDYGFVAESRRMRQNNAQCGVVASWRVTPSVSLFGHLNHSQALRSLKMEEHGNAFWGGAGIQVEF